MDKYIIANVKCKFSFFNKDFFKTRLKEYENDFNDEDVELTLTSSINNNILEEEGEVIISSNIAKCVLDKKGIYHYIKYKNKEKDICLKISYTKDYSNVHIEQIDHPHKYLSLTDREYIYTNQVFVNRVIFLGGVMIHSSCIAYKDQAILFSADSGTGKSTHTGLWKELYQDDVRFINDDKPILRIVNDKVYAFGTPWSGKTDLNSNLALPLKGIVILERGINNEINEVTLNEVIKTVFANIIVPNENKDIASLALSTYNDILNKVPLYRLKCNISLEAPKIVKEEVFKDE
jgi:hypothetical protein